MASRETADRLFDAYLFVDYSANSKPKRGADSIWACRANWVGGQAETGDPVNLPTRDAAHEWLVDRLGESVRRRLRVLVGFDFPYGYPAGFAAALTARSDADWRDVWRFLHAQVTDDARNRNNRWEVAGGINARLGDGPGPLWGCPAARRMPHLSARRGFDWPYEGPRGPLARLRVADRAAPGVQPVWKLLYAGSVGSQAMLGIPRLWRLRFGGGTQAGCSRVWPFETGFTDRPSPPSGPFVVHAEIWPGLVADRLAGLEARLAVRDARQVHAMCRWAAERDAAGELGRFFDVPDVAHELLPGILREEGWILGF